MLFLIIGKFIMSLLIAAAIILVIIKIKRHAVLRYDPSINLLKTRFAKGEIDEKEYKDRLTALTGK